jgi:DNA mismatch endonuclease (patch repair protein)
MSANKGKNTSPEIALRKALREIGLMGYRLNWKKAPGRPDIAFPGKKIAIFVHGCFWHRCPYCNYELPKSNVSFWKTKFSKNVNRDTTKVAQLEELGWRVLTVWECQIKNNITTIVYKLKSIS